MVKSYLSRRQVGIRNIFQDSDILSSPSILHLIGKQATKGQGLESIITKSQQVRTITLDEEEWACLRLTET